MSRHAYLIMAHSDSELLKLLLEALDFPLNDIYLHIDKKVLLMQDVEIRNIVKQGRIHIYRQYSISWGGDTQIKCELFLLGEAIKTPHSYYHFLSGVDIPLATQADIHCFFEKYPGRNYIAFNEEANSKQNFLHRIRHFRLFQNTIGRMTAASPLHVKLIFRLEDYWLKVQQLLHIDRIQSNPYALYKGSSWFSITHDLADYLYSQKKQIIKYFGYSLGADEVFIQTLVMNSEFAGTVYQDNLRYIDWSESDLPGAPKTLTMQDFESIIHSGKLFARKFSMKKDSKIVQMLYSRIM